MHLLPWPVIPTSRLAIKSNRREQIQTDYRSDIVVRLQKTPTNEERILFIRHTTLNSTIWRLFVCDGLPSQQSVFIFDQNL